MRLTRRRLLGSAAAGALAAAGIYELVDQLAGSPERTAAASLRPEQHLLDGMAVVVDSGVEVIVPPLHHEVVTATLRTGASAAELQEAQAELEAALRALEERHEPTPAGLGVTLAWGLPYFRRYVAGQAARHLPFDTRASAAASKTVRALDDAVRFPSDPPETRLEENDVAVLLRSDSLDTIADGSQALFAELEGMFRVTSIRRGFVGGGFDGSRSLPKRMATAAGVPGADLIPETAQLFLGFTSTQKAGLGPPQIANFETLGYIELGPSRYFEHGTHMHLSHMFENLEAWYLNFDHRERVDTTFKPGLDVPPDTLTVAQDAADVQNASDVAAGYEETRRIGHSGSIQPSSRLAEDVVGPDGTRYAKGTAIPQRADFNTLDNPFFWTAHRERDGFSSDPAAGLHFVVFNPSSDDFRRNRLAMDGVLPDGTVLPFEPRSRGQGFNAVLQTTHRQNFLVPPRAHRAFPLAELRA
ncbi:MAG TPA: hypothetical protein VFR32_01155 [Gaiellaceae bacterium]|nr:hypothetical protein [Gaiellaceae bacterium]